MGFDAARAEVAGKQLGDDVAKRFPTLSPIQKGSLIFSSLRELPCGKVLEGPAPLFTEAMTPCLGPVTRAEGTSIGGKSSFAIIGQVMPAFLMRAAFAALSSLSRPIGLWLSIENTLVQCEMHRSALRESRFVT
jgi:hypothetical protein